MSWEDIPLTKDPNNRSRGGMTKNEISIVYHKGKNSVSLTLNRFLNKPIQEGGFYYFGMKRETDTNLLVIILQKKQTANNILMYSGSKKGHLYNYKINSRAVVLQIMKILGLTEEGIYHIKISDNKSRNKECMLFEVEVPTPKDEVVDIYKDITEE